MKLLFNDKIDYLGYNIHPSHCFVEIYKEGDKYLVIMTDNNSGTSVTNACEIIATKILNELLWDANVENIVWVEHYPKCDFPETFDKIRFEYEKQKREFKNPNWFHIGEKLTEEIKLELLR